MVFGKKKLENKIRPLSTIFFCLKLA